MFALRICAVCKPEVGHIPVVGQTQLAASKYLTSAEQVIIYDPVDSFFPPRVAALSSRSCLPEVLGSPPGLGGTS